MTFGRADPGECIVCGASKCACTPGGPIVIEQLPATAAARASYPLKADIVQATLPPGQFTTGTYRRAKDARRK